MFGRIGSAFVLAFGLTSIANAGLTVYGSQDSFTSATTSYSSDFNFGGTTDEFDGVQPPIPLTFTGTAGSVSGSITGQNKLRNTPVGGRAAHTGLLYWEGGGSFTVSFTAAVSAFGFWGSDIGDFGTDCTSSCGTAPLAVLRLEFYDANGSLVASTSNENKDIVGSTTGGSQDFFGFAFTDGTKFSSVKFLNLTSGVDGQGFDDFFIGQARVDTTPPPTVPEPGTLALVGGAAALLGMRRRKVST